MLGQKLSQLRTAFAIIGDHLNDARRWLIGHRRFENRTICTADQLSTIIEGKVIVWQTFTVNRDLNQFAIFPIEGRPNAFEDVDMHIVRRKARSQCCPEGIDRNRIPPHCAINIRDETIPAAATTAFIRETDLLGVTELHALVPGTSRAPGRGRSQVHRGRPGHQSRYRWPLALHHPTIDPTRSASLTTRPRASSSISSTA